MLKKIPYKYLKIATYLYFVSLFSIVFFYGERLSGKDYSVYFNLKPLVKIFNYNWENPNLWMLYYSEISGNVILFLPFATAVSVIFKDITQRSILFFLVLCTLIIELLQFVFAIGVFDIDDIILNICGGVMGLVLYKRRIKSYL